MRTSADSSSGRCDAPVSQQGNDEKYPPCSSVRRGNAGGAAHSSGASRCASSAISRSRERSSTRASPRNPTIPGATSQSSPRARSADTTLSAVRMDFLPDERVRNARDGPEVVHANVLVRHDATRVHLGPGNELEDAKGIDDPSDEEW